MMTFLPICVFGIFRNCQVMNECEKILEKEKEDEDYANNTAQANEERLVRGKGGCWWG